MFEAGVSYTARIGHFLRMLILRSPPIYAVLLVTGTRPPRAIGESEKGRKSLRPVKFATLMLPRRKGAQTMLKRGASKSRQRTIQIDLGFWTRRIRA